jgi:hypothetical protein
MPALKFRFASVLTSLVLGGVICCAVATYQTPAPAAAPTDNSQLKDLFEEKCSACHDAPDPDQKGYTRAEWQKTVNRMMNVNGARNSITDDQAAQIVNYLSQFGPNATPTPPSDTVGVWENPPTVSFAYPFAYPENLSNFDIHGGAWKVVTADDPSSAFLKIVDTANAPAIVLENKHILRGGLDLQAQFHIIQSQDSSAIGLIFGATNAQNYLDVEYIPAGNTIVLSQVTDGQSTVLQQTAANGVQSGGTDGWHNLRVKVTDGGAALEVILDYQQQIKTTFPTWQGGKVGLISNGPILAGFRQMTVDSYQSNVAPPGGTIPPL